jgi:uncharacterized protein
MAEASTPHQASPPQAPYTQAQMIEALALIPHPEGGFFRETFRSGARPMASKGKTDPAGALTHTDRAPPERNELTSILYTLTDAQPRQRLAVNKSSHVHYWHAGASCVYHLLSPSGEYRAVTLGPNVLAGEVLQLPVKGGIYKCAQKVCGPGVPDFALLGEAVAPGFDFRDFALVSEEQAAAPLGAAQREALDALRPMIKPELTCDTDAFYAADEGCRCSATC